MRERAVSGFETIGTPAESDGDEGDWELDEEDVGMKEQAPLTR